MTFSGVIYIMEKDNWSNQTIQLVQQSKDGPKFRGEKLEKSSIFSNSQN